MGLRTLLAVNNRSKLEGSVREGVVRMYVHKLWKKQRTLFSESQSSEVPVLLLN
jgi:hypothetical protein